MPRRYELEEALVSATMLGAGEIAMPYLPTGYAPMRTTKVSYDTTSTLVETGDILITDQGPFGHAGIAYQILDKVNVAHIVNEGLIMGPGSSFPNNARIYRYDRADAVFRAAIVDTVTRMATAKPEYRFYGAVKSLGSHHFGKSSRERLIKYIGRPETCPKKMFCSEFVVLATQIATKGAPGGPFIYLDPLRTWPSTLREHLEKHPEWNFVGGWEKNPEKYGAF